MEILKSGNWEQKKIVPLGESWYSCFIFFCLMSALLPQTKLGATALIPKMAEASVC